MAVLSYIFTDSWEDLRLKLPLQDRESHPRVRSKY